MNHDDFHPFPHEEPAPADFEGASIESEDEDEDEETELPSASERDDDPAWKAELRRDIESWLDSLEDESDVDEEPIDSREPDLYSFFETLAALSTESRKSNRRTAETFSQWGSVLEKFQDELNRLGRQVGILIERDEGKLSRGHALAVLEILDRVERLILAFNTTPKKRWMSNDAEWREAWATQKHGFKILHEHVAAFLWREGIRKMNAVGEKFDPARMAAVQVEETESHPHNTVIEVETPGYLHGEETLRAAQVKIAVNPASDTDTGGDDLASH